MTRDYVGSLPNMDPYQSSRAAERAAREQRIALSHPIRAERIRAVHRIDRRARVTRFFNTWVASVFLFTLIVLLACIAVWVITRFWGAS